MLCNTELIDCSSYKIVLLLYCCVVRKCTALGPNLIYPEITYMLIKHLTVFHEMQNHHQVSRTLLFGK